MTTLAVFEIPTRPQVPQRQTISLAGTTYTLLLHWCDPAQVWIVDIADAVGNPIVGGLPLITGADLLDQLKYLGIGGALVAQTDHDWQATPTFTNLGSLGHFYFIPTQTPPVPIRHLPLAPGRETRRGTGRPLPQPSPPGPQPPPAFSVGAVTFISSDLRNFPLMVDTPLWTLSLWVKGSNIFTSQDNGWLFHGKDFFNQFLIDQHGANANTWNITPSDDGTNSYQFIWRDLVTQMSTTEWVNVLMSGDMGHPAGMKLFSLYFGDVAVPPNFISDPNPAFNIGFAPNAGNPNSDFLFGDALNADVSEVWFAPGQYMDFSNSANRAKFHDLGTGKPVFLGVNGSLPTGIPPTLYLHISRTESDASVFATNDSGAGSLTINGSPLTIAPTSPSD